MKSSIIFSVLSMALAASAAPTSGSGSSQTGCSAGHKQVCCGGTGGLLGDLLGTVQLGGSSCSGTKKCCSTNAATGTLVSLSLLNCVSIL